MAMSRGKKFGLAVLILVVLIFLILPFILGSLLRGTVEKSVQKELNAPVKLGGLSVSLLPVGATLSDLVVGDSTPEAGNAPLAKIDSLSVSVPMGVVFGGDLHVTGLTIDGADIHIGCDEKGKSTLTDFLANMPKGKPRTAALPIDDFEIANSTITLHVPKKLVAPKPKLMPEPVTITLGSLDVSELVLPAPGKPVPEEVWTSIQIEDLVVRSPVQGIDFADISAEGSGSLESGIELKQAESELSFATALDKPLRVREVKLKGLKIRDDVPPKGLPSTIERIHLYRALCLASPPADPNEPGTVIWNGSVLVDSVSVSESEHAIVGKNAAGRLAFYRLTGLTVDAAKIGVGPESGMPADAKGHLRVNGASVSTEGPGELKLEWKDLAGSYPKWTFTKQFSLTGVALTPFSPKAEKVMGAGIEKGTLSMTMDGKTTNGELDWRGSATVSKDTKVKSKGIFGFASGGLSKLATGKPIEPIKVRGTLESPSVAYPSTEAAVLGKLSQVMMGEGGPLKAFGSVLDVVTGRGLDKVDGVKEAGEGIMKGGIDKATEAIKGAGKGILDKLPFGKKKE